MELRELSLKLAERAGNRSERLAKIFEYTATPRQIQIMSELPQPPKPAISTAEVAWKLGLPAEIVQADLEDLFRKGLTYMSDYSTRTGWYFGQSDMQIRDAMLCVAPRLFPNPQQVNDMWLDYDVNECYRPWITNVANARKLNRRIIPAWRSVMNNPNLQPWEDWREIFKRKKLLSVRHCPCRMELGGDKQGHPTETCLKFDKWAEHDIAAGHARQLTVNEAVEIMDMTATAGLIGSATNIKDIIVMCNCCSDACFIFNAARQNNVKLGQIWDKSRYRAVIDQEKCKGCQKCVDNCNFDAITMTKVPGSKKMKAQIDPKACFGCGCCFMVCGDGAIAMDFVRPDWVVPDSLDQVKPIHDYDY